MAVVHLTQQDFSLIPLLNYVAEPIAGSATASSSNVGKLYRNTSTNRLEFVLNSTTVVSLPYSGSIVDSDISATAAIQLAKLAVNPLARANHTGTQLAATISDLIATIVATRLDQFAAPTSAVSMNSQRLANLADATQQTDATTLQQVTNLVSAAINGHDWKDGVRVALLTNVTLASPGATLDGVTLAAGDRVLLTGQTDATTNGIYVWNSATTAMTRSADANTNASVTSGMTVPIESGTRSASLAILTTADPITLGTTQLSFTYLANAAAYVAGTGITINGNTIALSVPVPIAYGGTGATTAQQARTNLGLARPGYAADVPALSAGQAQAIVHNLNSLDLMFTVYRKSDGMDVEIGLTRTDVNTVSVTADTAVPAGTLRIVVLPSS